MNGMFGLFKKKSTSESINESFAYLAKDIIDIADTLTDSYIAKRTQNGFAEAGSDKLRANDEFIYFFLHYLNRTCFDVGGKSAQVKIYEPVALYVYHITRRKLDDLYSDDDEKEIADVLIHIFADGINDAEMAYAKCYGWVIDGDVEHSVFFEAAKRVAIKKTEKELLLALDVVFLGMKMLNMNEKAKTLSKLIS